MFSSRYLNLNFTGVSLLISFGIGVLNFVDIELKKDINGRNRIIKSVFK